MVKYREDFIEETSKGNADLAKTLTTMTGGENYNIKVKELSNKAKQEQSDYDASTEAPKDKKVEDGATYQWTNSKGVVKKVKVIGKSASKDGEFDVEVIGEDGKARKTTVTQKGINKNLGEKIS